MKFYFILRSIQNKNIFLGKEGVKGVKKRSTWFMDSRLYTVIDVMKKIY